ncbi:MAG: ABC transporter substrate-binding protein [Synergistaceae bacterium]|jgi:iron complex transport system substrate-binding protein|nr:ABC transporter substrate-binding protein [Synergistaceae bacterium]
MYLNKQKFMGKTIVLSALIGISLFAGFAFAADSVVFGDQYGREVKLDKPAQRIVTVPIPAASMVMALDGTDQHLVGMNPSAKRALLEGILGKFFPSSANINSDIVMGEGFAPNVETLLTLAPDIVFQWGDRGDDIVKPIEAAKLNLALLKYGTQEDLETWIGMFGAALGKTKRADKILDWHRSERAQLEKAVAAIPQDKRPKIVYLYRYGDSIQIGGQNSYFDYFIKMVGGVNPAENSPSESQINEEQLLTWDPDIILLNGFQSALAPDDVYANANLAGIKAIKNRHVYKMPLGGYRWDPPNQESPLMWKWLAMLAHPDTFNWDLRSDIVEAYRFLYNQEPTQEDIDGILRLPMNATAANYSKFTQSK